MQNWKRPQQQLLVDSQFYTLHPVYFKTTSTQPSVKGSSLWIPTYYYDSPLEIKLSNIPLELLVGGLHPGPVNFTWIFLNNNKKE